MHEAKLFLRPGIGLSHLGMMIMMITKVILNNELGNHQKAQPCCKVHYGKL